MSLSREARAALPDSAFAAPSKRLLPLVDERHVRMAASQIDRTALTDDERAEARSRIEARAAELGIDLEARAPAAALAWSLSAMALDVPAEDHPNKMPFRGVLTRVDEPSDVAPGGSTGKRTVLPRAVAEQAIPTLLGMAVDFTPALDGHDRRNKIGLITEANVVGNAIEIAGFLYAADFPEECARIQSEKELLGFSFECRASIADRDADPWVIDRCVFTGAAVLFKHLAAYTTTSLTASAEGITDMDIKALFEAVTALTTKIEAGNAEIAALKADVTAIKEGAAKLQAAASLAGPIVDQVKPHVDALNACADSLHAAGIGTHATNGHVAHLRHMASHLAAAAVSGRVPHIYRDHDYLPSASVEASAGKGEDIAAAVAAAVAPLQEALKSATTQIADLKAAGFRNADAPDRKTLTPEVSALLGKLGIKGDAGDKLNVHKADELLEAAGVTGTAAIAAKLRLRDAGLLNA